MSRLRSTAIAALTLFAVHVIVALWLGSSRAGGLLSDLIQLALGMTAILAGLQAARRSSQPERYVWRLVALSYGIWLIAQSLSVYSDFAPSFPAGDAVRDMCFTFWFAPLALVLFLDLEDENPRISVAMILDFAQVIIFWIAAYLYLLKSPSDAVTGAGLAPSMWASLFAYYGILMAALLARRLLAKRPATRASLMRLVAILFVSSLADFFYYYGPGQGLPTGATFDLLWSLSLLVPAIFASTWCPERSEITSPALSSERVSVLKELFPLLYPLLILGMSVRIAHLHFTFGAVVVLLSFLCCCARLLVTQHQLIKTQKVLHYQATHDALTGALNRRAISEILVRELDRAERNGTSLGLILGDLDHFKAVNDSYGHQVGDAVLHLVSSTLAEGLRSYDFLGRYGGEEFLIVVPESEIETTYKVADRLRKEVAECHVSMDSRQITISMGVVCSRLAKDAHELLRIVDAALYAAKAGGRNRVALPPGVPMPAAVSTRVENNPGTDTIQAEPRS